MNKISVGLRVRIVHALAGLLLAGSGVLGALLSGATPAVGALILYAAAGLLVAIVPCLYVRHAVTKPLDALREAIADTRYDAFADRLLPQLQEPLLERHGEIAYAICCDTGGYVPTHNKRYTQPLGGDEKKDFVNNRTKRLFSDPVGKRCGAHELPFLLQTYRRDTGEIMHDILAPIHVNSRQWGGFRIGYRTE